MAYKKSMNGRQGFSMEEGAPSHERNISPVARLLGTRRVSLPRVGEEDD
jgi:hypothetical protein